MPNIKINKYKLAAAAIIMGALVMGFYPQVSDAQNATDLQQDINSINQQLEESEEQLKNLKNKRNTLENRLKILDAEAQQLQQKIDVTENEIQRTQNEISELEKELERTKELIQENVKVLYKQGSPSTLEILFSSENFTDFINRQEYLDKVKSSLDEAARESVAIKEDLEEKEEELIGKSEELDRQKEHLATKREEQRRLIEETRGEENRYQELVAELQEELKETERALRNLDLSQLSSSGPVDAGDAIGRVGDTGYSSGPHLHYEIRESGNRVDPMPYLNNSYQWPVPDSQNVTQEYGCVAPEGWYAEKCGNNQSFHPGIDIAGNGDTIIASTDGQLYVDCSENIVGTPAYGYMAVIDHGGGLQSIYGHMEAPEGSSCDYSYGF